MDPNLQRFHEIANELLKAIGFKVPQWGEDHKIISLTASNIGDVHFGLIDDQRWFMQVDVLPEILAETTADKALNWLGSNHLSAARWQPVVARDSENRLVCWLALKLWGEDCEVPTLLAAFDALLKCAESLLVLDKQPAATIASASAAAPAVTATSLVSPTLNSVSAASFAARAQRTGMARSG
jgi:hypothetical protein